MRRVIQVVVAVVIVLAVLGVYALRVQKIRAGPQGDPVRTVNTFMNTAVKISALLWDEQTGQALRRDLQQWTGEKGEGNGEIPESLKQYELEDPDRLCRKKGFGRVLLTAFCIFHFDSFQVKPAQIDANVATVDVFFVPRDVMGLRRLTASLGTPQHQRAPEPVSARFRLKKHWHAWYIDDIEGELGEMTSALGTLRKYK